GTQFIIALADNRQVAFANAEIARSKVEAHVIVGETYDALAASDAAAVTSGTATLEAGILGTPMVVVYKTSAVNYKLLEPMIDVPHYGLINLIAGERLATELIQSDLTAERLNQELTRLLEPAVNSAMRARLAETAAKLGKGGASKRAAEFILKMIERS
ncbi:MAG: lipid-A-disaccharide synthase, partial [Pyrinomonadaceae bacterium]